MPNLRSCPNSYCHYYCYWEKENKCKCTIGWILPNLKQELWESWTCGRPSKEQETIPCLDVALVKHQIKMETKTAQHFWEMAICQALHSCLWCFISPTFLFLSPVECGLCFVYHTGLCFYRSSNLSLYNNFVLNLFQPAVDQTAP